MASETKIGTGNDHDKYNVVYEKSTPEIYDEWAKEGYNEQAGKFSRGSLESVSKQIHKYLGRRKDVIRVMDAGCGTGNLAEVCNDILKDSKVEFKYEWWGLDFSQGMIDVASKKKGLYKDLVQGDLKKELTMYKDEQFDLIASSGTFLQGHVGHEAMPEMCRITKANGHMIFTVRPQLWDATKDEWIGALEKGGMKILSVELLPYAEGMDAPVVSCQKQGVPEMRVSCSKSVGFYVRAATSFLHGLEARPAAEGKEAMEAKPAVDELKITGLGDAIGVAVQVAAKLEQESKGHISKVETSYPEMTSGRGCALMAINVTRSE